ncbi:MAG: hypothetical protein CSA95_02530, partial [Bacteroidetes bacterium]
MLLHNIKQSIRGMLKHKVFTLLNLIGFAVGFAVCIIIMVFAYREYAVDTMFEHSPNIYRLVDSKRESVEIDRGIIPQLNKFSDVKLAVPLFYANFMGEGFREFLIDVETGNSIETSKPFICTNNDFFKMFGV